MKIYNVIEKIKRARQLEAESRWEEARPIWVSLGRKEDALACQTIIEARRAGDEFRNRLFKEKLEPLMEERYGLYPNDYEEAVGDLDQDHYTPEEWCDWYGEKYGLDKIY